MAGGRADGEQRKCKSGKKSILPVLHILSDMWIGNPKRPWRHLNVATKRQLKLKNELTQLHYPESLPHIQSMSAGLSSGEFRRVPASSGDHIDCWPNLRGSFFLMKQGEQAWVKYSGNIRGRDYKTTGLSASAMVEVMGDGIMMLPRKGIWHSSLVQNNSMKL